MNEYLLSIWDASSKSDSSCIVVPDGCHDLIMIQPKQKKAQWFISSLFDQARVVSIKAESRILGFRMKPGTNINEKNLLASISGSNIEVDEILSRLDCFARRKNSVDEALNCLASGIKSVHHAAKQIGVSQRTLQRLLIQETKRPPIYWIMLARVRKAARAISQPITYAEIADMYGYADQPHLCRAFKLWFNVSPSEFRRSPNIFQQIHDIGYD